jgi:hypothetical protein
MEDHGEQRSKINKGEAMRRKAQGMTGQSLLILVPEAAEILGIGRSMYVLPPTDPFWDDFIALCTAGDITMWRERDEGYIAMVTGRGFPPCWPQIKLRLDQMPLDQVKQLFPAVIDL